MYLNSAYAIIAFITAKVKPGHEMYLNSNAKNSKVIYLELNQDMRCI